MPAPPTPTIAPASGKLGVLTVGLGAVATTLIAGVELVKRGMAAPIGSLSQMGTIQYTPTTFSLQHLLEKLKGLYQLTADKKRIPLTITCIEDMIL